MNRLDCTCSASQPARLLTIFAFLLTTTLVSAPGRAIGAERTESYREAERWLQAYENAWEQRDPEKAASLFSASARYYETPFNEPFAGPGGVRDYWTRVTAAQRNIDFRWEVLAVESARVWAHWSAEFDVDPSAQHVKLDGIFQLELDNEGRCTELREWWHVESVPAAKP